MIEKEKIEKHVGKIVLCALLIICGIYILYSVFESPIIFELDLIFFVIGCCLISFSFCLISFSFIEIGEIFEKVNHPEGFVYCKKCKHIIRKKHIFCNDCRMDIKREIRHKESKKYINDYTKFYKEKKK